MDKHKELEDALTTLMVNKVQLDRFDEFLTESLLSIKSKNWTPRQSRLAYLTLAKYEEQLSSSGLNYADFKTPNFIAYAPIRNLTIYRDRFVFSFPYSETLKDALKDEIPKSTGRMWEPVRKEWIVPLREPNIEFVIRFALAYHFDIDEDVILWINKLHTEEKLSKQLSKALVLPDGVVVPEIDLPLRPFQLAGVIYAMQAKRCFIADDIGLGKSIESLAVVHHLQAFPSVIVCLASLKWNWKNEIRKWFGDRYSIEVLSGMEPVSYMPSSAHFTIVNYSILQNRKGEGQLYRLMKMGARSLILDECHALKNNKTLRSRAIKALAENCDVVLALSGTPLINRPNELESQLEILGRLYEFGGKWQFRRDYTNPITTRWGTNYGGASNLLKLNEELRKRCYIRRLKMEVLDELPEKQRMSIEVDVDNWTEYRNAELDLVSWIKESISSDKELLSSISHLTSLEQRVHLERIGWFKANNVKRAEQLSRINILRQICGAGKVKTLVEWLQSIEDKIIVFAFHRKVQRAIMSYFPTCAHILGDDSQNDRERNANRFQEDEACRLIVCSLTEAGALGLNLTASSIVAFSELGWTPAIHDQGEGRSWRMTQTNPVSCYYFIGRDTIDEDIMSLLEEKRRIVHEGTEGTEYDPGSKHGILFELVSRLSNK